MSLARAALGGRLHRWCSMFEQLPDRTRFQSVCACIYMYIHTHIHMHRHVDTQTLYTHNIPINTVAAAKKDIDTGLSLVEPLSSRCRGSRSAPDGDRPCSSSFLHFGVCGNHGTEV